ncbi:Pre-rRNA-processing protein [Podosphaera aphanis]|nr:Pre-rRNA-processing protein [Podosphaera aphanis]
MPKQKASKGAVASSEITDPRFSSISTNPRFRLPSKKQTRTKIDKRFSRLLTDDDFSNSASVDRYGRKLNSSTKKKALERLYLPDKDEEQSDEDEKSVDGDALELANDEEIEKELEIANKYDPARGGGFSSSSEDEESGDEDGGVRLEVDEEEELEFPDMQAAQTTVEMGDVSPRFAVVNLDWDNLKSVDLFAVFSSFLPPGGKILDVTIYPSEFGKERMNREELEGPPKEIFTQKDDENGLQDDDSEDDEKIIESLQRPDDGAEYNDSALRKYQLERLRYYYAIVTCSSSSTAQAIYEATDGREYLSSANFLDLRFVPDGVEFDDKPRDQCKTLPEGYRPTEFVTTALQHSKVKLTWDTDPSENVRKEVINRAFSGSRSEINENDLRAYLGSDSETDEEASKTVHEEAPKLSKKEANRLKMRAALGLNDQEPTSKSKKSSAPVGEMEVTFTAGLNNSDTGGVFQNEPIVEETTAERYVRLEKERKARRRERAKAKREGRDPDLVQGEEKNTDIPENKEEKDLGFDDPFFAGADQASSKSDPKSSSQRKAERKARKEAKAAEAQALAAQKAQLESLMEEDKTENGTRHLEHFDINEIARAEKNRKKKSKSKREDGKRGGLQESFEMDVHDPRFERVFESHEYAIDPSNPRFKGTDGMKKLLEEGRRKRNIEESEGGEIVRTKKKCKESGETDLNGLIERVKRSKK